MPQRVTDEQARILTDCDYEAIVQIGIGTTINTAHLASDLLDARERGDKLYDELLTAREEIERRKGQRRQGHEHTYLVPANNWDREHVRYCLNGNSGPERRRKDCRGGK